MTDIIKFLSTPKKLHQYIYLLYERIQGIVWVPGYKQLVLRNLENSQVRAHRLSGKHSTINVIQLQFPICVSQILKRENKIGLVWIRHLQLNSMERKRDKFCTISTLDLLPDVHFSHRHQSCWRSSNSVPVFR